MYETADGEYVSIASYEPKFYANLLALIGPLGFDDVDPAAQMDRAQWPALKQRIATLIRTRTSADWVAFFAGHEVWGDECETKMQVYAELWEGYLEGGEPK